MSELPQPDAPRRGRRSLRLLIGLVAVLLIVVTVALAYLHSPPGRRLVLGQVRSVLAAQNIAFDADQLEFNLFALSLSLRNVVVRSPQMPAQPFATIALLKADLSLLNLIRGRYVLQSGQVEGVNVHYLVGADGRDNLPRPPTDPNDRSEPLDYLITNATISRTRVRYENRVEQIDLDLPIQRVSVTGTAVTDRHRVVIDAAGGRLTAADRMLPLDKVAAELDLGSNDIRIERAALDSETSHAEVSGTLTDFHAPRADVRLQAALDVARVAERGGLGEPARGRLTIDATARGPVAALEIDGRVEGRALAIRRLEQIDLDLTAAYSVASGRATARTLQLRAPWGTLSGEGSFATKDVSTSTASVAATRVDVRTIMRALEISPVAATRVDGRVQATWPGLDYMAATGRGTIVLTPTQSGVAHSVIPVGGRVAIDGSGRLLEARITALRAAGARMDGRVTLADRERLGGTISTTVLDVGNTASAAEAFLGRAKGSLLPVPITGAVRSQTTLGGNVQNPRATVEVAAPALTIADAQTLSASGRVAYTRAAVEVLRLDVDWAGGHAAAAGRIGLAGRQPLALTFQVDALAVPELLAAVGQDRALAAGTLSVTGDASGTLAQPTATASIAGEGLAVLHEPLGTLAADVRLENQLVTVARLTLDKPQPEGDGRLSAQGHYQLNTRAYDFTLDSNNLALVGLTLPDGRPVRGQVALTSDGQGTADRPMATMMLAVDDLRLAGADLGRVAVDAVVANGAANLEVTASRFGLQTMATIAVAAPHQATVDARITGLDLATLPLELDTPLTGTLSARVKASGDLDQPERALVEGTIEAFEGTWNAHPFRVDAPAVLRLANERISIERLALSAQDSTLSVTGTLPLNARSGEGALQLDARANLATLAGYAPAGTMVDATGTLVMAGTVRGNLEHLDPDVLLTVAGAAVTTPELMPGITNLTMRARIAAGVAAVEQLAAAWGPATLDVTARLPLGLLPGLPVSVPQAEGPATVRASLQNFDPSVVPGAPEGVSGRISVVAEGSSDRGALEAITGSVTFSELSVGINGLDLAQQQASTVQIAAGTATITQMNLAGSAGTVRAQGSVGLTDTRQMDLSITGMLETGALAAFTDAVHIEGPASFDVTARGTADAPELNGTLAVTDAMMTIDEPAVYAQGLSARVELAGNRVTLTSLTGEVNGGKLDGRGSFVISGGDVRDVNFRATATDVAFEAPLDLRSLSDTTLTITEREGRVAVDGTVTIKEGGLTGDLNFDTGLLATLTAPRSLDLTEERNPLLERMDFNIQVRTSTPLLVDNNLARAEITTNLRVLGTPYETGMSGRLNVLEGGQITLNERNYEVERASVSFLDERRIVPSLDLQLATTAAGYDVTVAVTGQPGDTKTTLTSDPSLPEPDIMALLVTGRTLDDMRGEEYEVAKEQVMSYLAGRIGSRLGRGVERATGLSEVRLEPNLIANEADPSARLTVGQDLTSQLKLVYSSNLTNSSDQVWVARYDVTRRFQTNATRQSDGSYRLDFRHDVRVGGRPAPGRLPRTRPTVGSVHVEDGGVLGEREARRLLDLEPAHSYDFFAGYRGVRDVEKALYQQGRLQARVRLDRMPHDDVVDVVLRIQPGPMVTIAYEGLTPPSKVDKEVRRQWSRGVFDTQRGRDGVDALREWLIRERYLSAEVRYRIDDAGAGARRVLFTIVQGPRYERIELEFSGAAGVPASTLDDIIDEQHLEQHVFTDPLVVTALLGRYYREQGYLSADVATPRYEYRGSVATAVFDVAEGPRFTIGSITVTGNRVFASDELLRQLPLVVGDPYLPATTQRSLDRIRELYWSKAYNDMRSEYALALDREAGVVNVAFELREGPRSVVAEVHIEGNDETSNRLVREQFELHPADPLDLAALSRSRRNLYDTGAFSIVDVTRETVPAPGQPAVAEDAAANAPPHAATPAAGAPRATPPAAPPATLPATPRTEPPVTTSTTSTTTTGTDGNGEGDKPVRLNVAVREVQPFQLRYGASFDTERGIGGILDVSNHNSLGKARVVGLTTRYDSQLREGRIYMSQPTLRYWPVQSTVSLYYREERNPETTVADPFDLDRSGISIQQERKLRNSYIWTYGYRYERARKSSGLPGALPAPWITVSPLTSTFLRETRDDILDASKGSFTSHAFSYSPSWLGADSAYIKYYGQYFRYTPLERERRKRFTNEILRPRFVYAAGARLGIARGWGLDLPETERFYAGGSTTLRGFEQNAVGPIGTDRIPTGGSLMLVINNEVRTPLFSIVDGVAFIDVGNVFRRVSDLSLGDLRQTTGVGVRLRTPWFLVRGDYGVVLQQRAGEARGRFYFSIGQAF